MNKNQVYPTDLTDPQWECLKELIPPAKPGGHPHVLDMRAVVNAILSLTVTGCQWRMLPREYLGWQSVSSYFRAFRNDGTWRRRCKRETPVMESAITMITDDRFYYRGHDALTLATTHSVEQVAALIWA